MIVLTVCILMMSIFSNSPLSLDVLLSEQFWFPLLITYFCSHIGCIASQLLDKSRVDASAGHLQEQPQAVSFLMLDTKHPSSLLSKGCVNDIFESKSIVLFIYLSLRQYRMYPFSENFLWITKVMRLSLFYLLPTLRYTLHFRCSNPLSLESYHTVAYQLYAYIRFFSMATHLSLPEGISVKYPHYDKSAALKLPNILSEFLLRYP